MDNTKEEHFELRAGNKAHLVIFNFYLGIKQQNGDKRIGLQSYYIRVAGLYSRLECAYNSMCWRTTIPTGLQIDHSCTSLEL